MLCQKLFISLANTFFPLFIFLRQGPTQQPTLAWSSVQPKKLYNTTWAP